jgi:hypothetical protein
VASFASRFIALALNAEARLLRRSSVVVEGGCLCHFQDPDLEGGDLRLFVEERGDARRVAGLGEEG